MTHAVAEAVLVEQFRVWPAESGGIVLDCPGCPWSATEFVPGLDALGELLTAARRHILDDHPGNDPAAHQHAYTAVLHAVDQLAGDTYPALIAEEQVPADDGLARVCEATGNTVRGPLLPYEADGVRRWICKVCFNRARRNASHVADPLPLEGHADE